MHLRPLSVAVAAVSLSVFGLSSAGAATPDSQPPTKMPATTRPARSLAEVARSAREDVFWLADDAREGRAMDTKGLEEAGQFIADRFKKLGLSPLPAVGGYFQTFEYNAGKKLGPGTTLSLNGAPLPGGAFTSFVNSKEGAAKGEVAFVGYAIKSKEHHYDDFAGIDLKGRVALAMRWEPHDEAGKSRWADDGSNSPHAAIAQKAERAAKAGATALILVNAPMHHEDADKLMEPRAALRQRSPIPVFHITIATANKILTAAGAPALAELQKEIDAAAKPASWLLEGAAIEARVEVVSSASDARNVIAMLPGTGPHADEFIVVGAHYDHVGKGAYGSRFGGGKIHNGADDNASGTVAVLQLAEELSLAGPQGRSIIFALFTHEELGLIGSAKFVEEMPVPKEKIAAMLNLDMVGRISNGYLYVGGGGTADAFDPVLAAADARSPIELKSIGKGGLGPSDHLNFSRQRIPSLFFYSGTHADYHGPGDDADKINYDGLAQVTGLTFDVVHALGAIDKPTYVARYDTVEPDTDVVAGELPSTRPAATITRSRVTLGVEPDYAAGESLVGVRLAGVSPDSAASTAGLQEGDVITQMNDRKIETVHDLTGFLSSAKPDDVVKVIVLRDGQPITLEAKLRARGS
jgi:hypothetical protein